MKILLVAVNAKYIHSNLAVYDLRAYAKAYQKADVQIEIAEYTINHRTDDILAGIYRAKPDVLCFSCYIWNLSCVEELSCEYHKLCPGVPVWAGGPEVSYETESFLKEHPEMTGVMIGEGEQTFLELCEYYAQKADEKMRRGGTVEHTDVLGRQNAAAHIDKQGQPNNAAMELSEIAGIAYREGEEICFTAARGPVDLSTIPFCYDEIEDTGNRIIYYESSRGCPFRCSYCLSSVEKQLRFRDIGLVKQELSVFLERKVKQVKFVDRTFNCNHAHALEIWTFLKEHDNGVTNFHFEISADLLTEEELALLAGMRKGLVQLEIGVQSTNDATIAEIHRTMELGRLKEVVGRIQSAGNIHEHLDLIAGLPYEDYAAFSRSFDEIYALKPDQLQLGFLKVLKGSYMYEHAAEYGLIYRSRPPYEVLRTNWLDFPELLAIGRVEEMLEVYYNSGQYEMTMKLLETQFESAFAMFERMGAFYDKKGYFQMSHSRVRRAEILLEFAKEYAPEAVRALEESLIFDLYYRENIGNRPAWAAEPSAWKELTRKYCKNGKQSHVERFFYRFPGGETRTVKKLPGREKTPCYVLFDYTRRDPLNHQASYCYLDE
ncbi:MAG: B12-binding domain-containing radical SAM protein [Roseburia sp.]|nr:B12-binding domain-containing radical SAM protein [Roseburia sp.]